MAVEAKRRVEALRSHVDSVCRTATEGRELARTLADHGSRTSVERVLRPKSLASAMKKAGIALFLSPDPLTDIAGVALVASSYIAKRRDPISLKTMMMESKKLVKELESLRVQSFP